MKKRYHKFRLNRNKPIQISIDAGDLQPEGEVTSGIHRLVTSFTNQFHHLNDPAYCINYYYFGPSHRTPHTYTNITYHRLPRCFYSTIHLPFHTLKDGSNVFLGFSGYIPRLLQRTSIKKIAFIHDFGFCKYPQLYTRPQKLVKNTTYAIENADKIVVFSQYMKSELLSRFPTINAYKVTQIYAGTDHLLTYNDNHPQKKIGKYFLYVGVIKPMKNITRLFRCFREFMRASPDKNYQLVLIGKKEDDYYLRLMQDSSYRSIRKKITFVDHTSDFELFSYLHSCVALLNISCDEGFCFPVLENLTRGKPVITNEHPLYHEYREFFTHLYSGSDDTQIVHKMLQIAKNPPLHHQRVFRKEFTWSDFTTKLLTLIKEIT